MIPFTQYLRPNGQRILGTIDRPDAVTAQALAVIACGGRFTAEVLTTGEVSLAVELGDDDHDIEICRNGPEVEAAVDRLVARAHASIVLKEES